MSGPFELVDGNDDLVCADGVCAVPSPQPGDDSADEDSARA